MTDAERRKRTEEELFLLFGMLTRDTRHNLYHIVTDYYAGRVSLWQLSDALITALREAHAHAAYLGRRLAGDRRPFGRNDQDFAASVVIGQARFLEGLVTAIQSGQYAVEEGDLPSGLVRRLGMYAGRLRGTANEAWTLNLPGDAMIEWVLGQKEHCTPTPGFVYICTELAAGGPYPANAMPTQPGNFETPCLGNCDCHTQVVGGGEGFPLVGLND